eukprot:2984748-Amphidinium_carterae.1
MRVQAKRQHRPCHLDLWRGRRYGRNKNKDCCTPTYLRILGNKRPQCSTKAQAVDDSHKVQIYTYAKCSR